MKKKIDYENWDRKEIYELFHGYLFYLTVEIDITEFLETIHKHQWKFYPSICIVLRRRSIRMKDTGMQKWTVRSVYGIM